MLKRLQIRNYALIDELEIDFSEHLTIITGETGAGKSILLGALGMVMGERADMKVFYNDGEKCVVEATFDVDRYDLQDFFTENELDYDSELVIRRELSPAGKSRAFVNDTPVNNQILQRLTESLIDLHQQFDTLDIHNVNFQLRMIDALADNAPMLKTYQQGYRKYASDRKKRATLIDQSENGAKEMEFMRFQYEELQKAALVSGEQATMEEELLRLTNAEHIKQTYGSAYNYLNENEQNIIGQLREIGRSMSSTRKFSGELSALSDRLDAVVIDLQDIAKDCERIDERTEHDPQRISEVQERLNIVYKLQKKHAVNTIDDLLKIQETLEAQLGGFTDLGATIAQLEAEIKENADRLYEMAATLSTRRKSVVADFEQKVAQMLTQLSMPHARLQVAIADTQALSNTGTDDVQFLFASNAGSKYLPIKDVASGGELSRLTLCTKSLVADAIPLPTLIFDEIDSGVSGDVSMKMGLILKELSARHQVISITHTPQVAARADRHYFVFKKVNENRTVTNVRLLTPDERVRSIAVMLSGNPPSESALNTAQELVQG
jgi:DNA repair protein RecN (Recombination protein N)